MRWGERWEVRGERWEVRGERWEVRGERWEVRGERWEVRGERWEVRGERWEVRGERWEMRRSEMSWDVDMQYWRPKTISCRHLSFLFFNPPRRPCSVGLLAAQEIRAAPSSTDVEQSEGLGHLMLDSCVTSYLGPIWSTEINQNVDIKKTLDQIWDVSSLVFGDMFLWTILTIHKAFINGLKSQLDSDAATPELHDL